MSKRTTQEALNSAINSINDLITVIKLRKDDDKIDITKINSLVLNLQRIVELDHKRKQ